GDLTRMADVERVVATVEARLGPVDILVHNAGGDIAAAGGKPDPNDAVMIKESDIRAVLERNLLSTIFVCQRVAASMMAQPPGRRRAPGRRRHARPYRAGRRGGARGRVLCRADGRFRYRPGAARRWRHAMLAGMSARRRAILEA